MTRKKPEEWRNPFYRWLPAIMASFMLGSLVVHLLTGGLPIGLLLFYILVIGFGYAVQLEYELKEGVLSHYQ